MDSVLGVATNVVAAPIGVMIGITVVVLYVAIVPIVLADDAKAEGRTRLSKGEQSRLALAVMCTLAAGAILIATSVLMGGVLMMRHTLTVGGAAALAVEGPKLMQKLTTQASIMCGVLIIIIITSLAVSWKMYVGDFLEYAKKEWYKNNNKMLIASTTLGVLFALALVGIISAMQYANKSMMVGSFGSGFLKGILGKSVTA